MNYAIFAWWFGAVGGWCMAFGWASTIDGRTFRQSALAWVAGALFFLAGLAYAIWAV